MKSVNELFGWADDRQLEHTSLKRVVDMIQRGRRPARQDHDPIQFPEYFLEDGAAKPWHFPSDYEWVKRLEASFDDIQREAALIDGDALFNPHPQNNELADHSTWNTFFLFKNGKRFEENCALCPETKAAVETIPGVDVVGRVYFSAMGPGIHIKPHCGPHNFKLRCHLGIQTPVEAEIRVASETRKWERGKCLVFDDSFDHEVWNAGDDVRVVLIVDAWNPALTEIERDALLFVGIPSA